MKKNFLNSVFIAFSITLLFSGCSKSPNKILPKKDGIWNGASVTIITVGGASSTQPANFAFTFKDDGTGSINEAGTISTFTWVYSKENKTITFTQQGALSSVVYNVSELKSKSEKWTYQTTYQLGGITYVIDQTINLTKVD